MSIDIVNKDIKKCKEEIADFQQKINDIYKERMNKYFKLREIMENEKNHEGGIICKPLLPNKKREYQKVLDDYKRNFDRYKESEANYLKKIDEKFTTMSALKKNLLEIEKINEAKEIQAFEMKRRKNLEKIINYIVDKNLNVAAIQRVKEIIQEEKTDK